MHAVNVGGSSGGVALSELLPPAAIRIGVAVDDWRGAVRESGAALVASGATDPAYTDEMVSTVEELGPYIVIAPGLALAHSRPSPAVLHAGVSLVTLARPVDFGNADNDPVSLVVGLAAPDETGHITALATLADYLADDDRRATLMSAPDVDAVRALIRAYESDRGASG